jgi:hypothetical protein
MLLSGYVVGMSTHVHTKTTTVETIAFEDLYSPREVHHGEENHEGCASECALCDRFEIAEYNGYVNGMSSWYDEVGQFLDGINDTIGVAL